MNSNIKILGKIKTKKKKRKKKNCLRQKNTKRRMVYQMDYEFILNKYNQ